MGWKEIPSDDPVVSFYSITDDIKYIHDKVFEFLSSLTPAVLSMIVLLFILTMVVSLFFSIRYTILRGGGVERHGRET